jgi:RNA polymerase sigma factor (sigma-70 family)
MDQDEARDRWGAAVAAVEPNIRAIVGRLARFGGRGRDAATRDDMAQAARLVLRRALECHDPDGAARWRTYAKRAVTRAARREMAANWPIWIPYREHPASGRRKAKFAADADRALAATPLRRDRWDIASPDADPARLDRLDWPAVLAAISELSERERRVIERRHGLDGSDPATPGAIAAELGITRQGVEKVYRRAIGRLRERLRA